jgi:alkylhydroperoxidase family enzyme
VLCAADPTPALTTAQAALWRYAHKVAVAPWTCARQDVDALQQDGCSDEEISAAVQVVAFFSYINRIADGLGVDLEPDMQ